MPKTIMRLGTALAAATFACAGAALAQQRPGGAPAAPHISAPAVHFNAAPQVAIPHISAAPRVSAAPRISAVPHVNVAPYIGASRLGAARAPGANVRTFTPRTGTFARQTIRGARTRHALQTRGPTATRSAAQTAVRRNLSRHAARGTGTATRSTGGQITQANGRNRPNSAQLTTLSRPLGERNRNLADRHRFFDERRRFHHGGFIGWFGPVFWPYAYDDVFDYAFWPAEYDDYGFWPAAYDDLLAGVFYNPGSGDIYASVGAPQGGRRGRARAQAAYRAAAAACRAGDPGLTQWPIAEIAQAVQPTRDQQHLLDDLKAASAQALKLLQTACPASPPSTPPGRLDAVVQRLGVMVQALDTVRPALAKFYDALTDEQKARFNAIEPRQGGTAAGQGAADTREASPCGGQAPGTITSQAIDRIERDVRPNDRQNADLQALRDASAKAADLLREACPTQTPLTPVARLDAMRNRLQAMLDAVSTVRPALARFYDSLSDEQKAHFNIMGPQQG